MKTAYLDAFSGLSGDMLVGALLDTGADFEALKLAVAQLGMGGYRLSRRRRKEFKSLCLIYSGLFGTIRAPENQGL